MDSSEVSAEHDATNPFRPTFGAEPPMLVGRDAIVRGVNKSLDEGVGSPARATLLTGPRGTGKTVLLGEIEEAATERGWVVLSETATPGLLDRLIDQRIPAAAEHLENQEPRRRLTGASAGPVGISWENRGLSAPRPDLRRAVGRLTELLADHGTGVLITVDELHGGKVEELREVGTTIQHCFREGRDVAFVGAGLPAAVSYLLSDQVLTFLRRADRHHLGPLTDDEVALALTRPIRDRGRSIDPAALERAIDASAGYPFLVQAIGYHSWEQDPNHATITLADVESGVVVANDRIGRLVVEPALHDLSQADRAFLAAMAVDEGPSRMGHIRERLSVSASVAGNYRSRLLDTDLIVSLDRGVVDFATPWMRDHVREQLQVDMDHQPWLEGLSRGDRAFLAAMAVDNGPSRISDLRARLGGVGSNYIGQYRSRLLAAGLIEVPERGLIDFTSHTIRAAVRNEVTLPPVASPSDDPGSLSIE